MLSKTFITKRDIAYRMRSPFSKPSSYSGDLLFRLHSEASLRFLGILNTFLRCRKDIIVATETTKPPASIQLRRKNSFLQVSKESK